VPVIETLPVIADRDQGRIDIDDVRTPIDDA